MKSHNAPVAQATRIGLSIRRFALATPLARKMLKDWWVQFTQRRQHRKTNQKLKVIMSLLTPIQPNGATRELEGSLQGSQLELKAAPNFHPVTVDPRDHMSFVGRIYQVSGAGSADGHYCPFCYDSGGEFARLRRNANHWQCCACEAVFYD